DRVRLRDAGGARNAPPQRSVLLGALSRFGGSVALHRMLHGRILARAPAPARTRQRRRRRDSATRKAVYGRRRIDKIPALARRPAVIMGLGLQPVNRDASTINVSRRGCLSARVNAQRSRENSTMKLTVQQPDAREIKVKLLLAGGQSAMLVVAPGHPLLAQLL